MQQDLNGPQGTTGATGTGVGSITKQFYLSTSKTTQTGGSWVETMPTWVNGKYLWARDKIVYTNPASTEYTTPVVSSEWEAVNEIEIGGRNLLRNSTIKQYGGSLASGEIVNKDKYLIDGTVIYTRPATANLGIYVDDYSLMEPNTEYIISFYAKVLSGTVSTFYMFGSSPNNVASSYLKIDGVLKRSSAKDVSITIDLSDGEYHFFEWGFTTLSTITTAGNYKGNILQWNKSNSVAYSMEMKGLKWEKGNVPTDWTLAPEDGAQGKGYIYVVGTQTTSTGSWTGKTSEISTLTAGTQILYKLPYAGNGNATLNLTLADGTTTGAKNCYYKYSSTRLSTQYPANSTISMLYDGTQWIVTNPYTNDNTFDRTKYSNYIKAAAAITADRLIVGSSSGYVVAAGGISFDTNYPVLWASSAISAASTGTNNYITLPSRSLTLNKSGTSLTQWKMAYIKGILSGSIFTIDTAVFSNEPTTEDGKYYIPIGICYDKTHVYFDCGMPTVYKYYDGAFRALPRT